MNRVKYILQGLFIALTLLACANTGSASDSGLKITEMAVTTKIVRGNPIDSVHRISSTSVNALYCFTRLESSNGKETSIRHIWYRDGIKVGEYNLPVKGKNWRTFSKKSIKKGLVGDWRVDALDSDGHILKTVTFRMN
jgi:hypothetical protein